MLVPCVDQWPATININKRHKYTNTKFIRVLSAAHLIHQSIWIALHILILLGDGRKTSVEAQSIRWLKWNSASTIPPLGFSIRAITQLKQRKNFHISWRKMGLFECTKCVSNSVGRSFESWEVCDYSETSEVRAVKENMLHWCLCSRRGAGPGYLKASVASS